MNKGRKWVEGGIYDFRKSVWTNYNVLWTSNSPATFQTMMNEIL